MQSWTDSSRAAMRGATVVRPSDCTLREDWLVPFREILNQHGTGGLAVYLLEYGSGAEVPRHSHGLEDEYLKEDRKSTRLNSSHIQKSRMPSSA